MDLVMDPDVQLIAEFMQCNIQADKLRGVSSKLGRLSELLWGHLPVADVRTLVLANQPVNVLQQPSANE